MKILKNKNIVSRGFTLIELLIVIAIIGLLSSVVLASLNSARKKARDARRISDMKQMMLALEMYYDKFTQYPDSDNAGCGGWDTPENGTFISPLVDMGFLPVNLKDPVSDSNCGNYEYYRYPPNWNGTCPVERGSFYVLRVIDMETSGNPYPSSEGFKCGLQDWQTGVDWVAGRFEK